MSAGMRRVVFICCSVLMLIACLQLWSSLYPEEKHLRLQKSYFATPQKTPLQELLALPPPTPLRVSEVYNLARWRPARLSNSSLAVGNPAMLVDGIPHGLSNNPNGSVNLSGPNAFWEVDLGEDVVVEDAVVVFHPSSLRVPHKCRVLLLSANRTLLQVSLTETKVGVTYWQLQVPQPHTRFVQVRTQGIHSLPIEEVEVYGVPMREEPPEVVEKGEDEHQIQTPAVQVGYQAEGIKVRPKGSGEGSREGIYLVISYFKASAEARKRELDSTLRRNLQNPYLAQIHVLVEAKIPCDTPEFHVASLLPFTHPKLVVFCQAQQPTYRDFFVHVNKHLAGRLVMISNGDILFTDTIRHAFTAIPPQSKKAHVLARWPTNCPHLEEPGKENRCWVNFLSYDTFVFRAPVEEEAVKDLDFFMNRQFSEHATSRALKKVRRLSNPCLDVVTLHNHCSDIRTWKEEVNDIWAVPEPFRRSADAYPAHFLKEDELSSD